MTRAPSLHPVILVVLLWLAGLGAAAQFAKIGVPFAAIQAQYPDTGPELGLLLSLISVFGILFGLMAGIFVARLGYRRLLLAALGMGALASFYQASLPGFNLMLASRIVEGASHLTIVVAAPTLIAQLSSARFRGMAMTLWSTFFGVTYALMAWLGLPFVASHGLGSLFIAHGAFMLVLAGLLAFGLRGMLVRNTAPFSLGMVWRNHMRAYRSPFIAAPAAGWAFYTITFVALLAILPGLLPEDQQVQVASLMPLASIAVSLIVVPILLRLMPATTIIALGFTLAIAVLALFWLNVGAVIISIAVFAVLGLVQGASFAAVPQLNTTAEDQALANGAMAQMGNLGNTIGTPVLLAVLVGFDLSGLLIAVIACYLAGLSVHIWLARRRRG